MWVSSIFNDFIFLGLDASIVLSFESCPLLSSFSSSLTWFCSFCFSRAATCVFKFLTSLLLLWPQDNVVKVKDISSNRVNDLKKIKDIVSTETLIEVEVDLGW